MSARRALARSSLFVLTVMATAMTSSIVADTASAAVSLGSPAARAAVHPADTPGNSPLPTFSSAYGLACPRASQCLLVGAYTVLGVTHVLTEAWNGSAWTVTPSSGPPGAQSSVLNAISCASKTSCVAVGQYTARNSASWGLTELWDGHTWQVVSSPRPPGEDVAVLDGVSCTAASSCVAVGSALDDQSEPHTLVESWNGTSWSIVPSPDVEGALGTSLTSVSCTSPTQCQAAGSYLSSDYVDLPVVESWDGTAWSVVQTPSPPDAQGSSFTGISCASRSRCVAVGSYFNRNFVGKALAESWDGTRWSLAAVPSPVGSPNTRLYGVSCGSSTSCVAVGHSYDRSNAAKDEALAESWNGSSWSMVATPSPSTTSALNAISCAGGSHCLAAGLFFDSANDYLTLAESWDGSALRIVNQDAELAGISCVTAAWCASVGSMISTASVGATLVQVWSGHHWSTVATPNPVHSEGSYLDAVSCLRVDWCIAVGYYFHTGTNARETLVESWNGHRWSIVASPDVDGAAFTILDGISCVDAAHCMAVGAAGGRSLAESWDGSTWTIVATSDPSRAAYDELSGVECDSATHCLAVGFETDVVYHADLTLAEEWDGSSWQILSSARPGKSYFLSSVLHGISCGADSGCWAVGYRELKTGKTIPLLEHWTQDRFALVDSVGPAKSEYSELGAVSCVSGTGCAAVGTSLAADGALVPLTERWAGTGGPVTAASAPAAAASGISYLRALSCTGPSHCMATGATGNPATLGPLAMQDGPA